MATLFNFTTIPLGLAALFQEYSRQNELRHMPVFLEV
jgi:hypothetical protein